MSEDEPTREPSPQGDVADGTEPPPGSLPLESEETKLARRRSQHLLLFSLVLFFIGVTGLGGLSSIEEREKRRRARVDREIASAAASAARAASSRDTSAGPTPLPAWTPSRRP